MSNRRNRPAQAHCVALPPSRSSPMWALPPTAGCPWPPASASPSADWTAEGLSLSGVAGPPGWSLGLG